AGSSAVTGSVTALPRGQAVKQLLPTLWSPQRTARRRGRGWCTASPRPTRWQAAVRQGRGRRWCRMPLARTHAVALVGMQGHVIEVEADIENGLVGLQLIGLPDTALREARDRIRSAVINSGHDWPMRRITVGLSPASLPKRGSGFDVGIAIALL